jgi:hypothetical protein
MSVLDRNKSVSGQPLTSKFLNIIGTAAQIVKLAMCKSTAHHEAAMMMA